MRTLAIIIALIATVATSAQEGSFSPQMEKPTIPECPDRNPFLYQVTWEEEIGGYVVWYELDPEPGVQPMQRIAIVTLRLIDMQGNPWPDTLQDKEAVGRAYLALNEAKIPAGKETEIKPSLDDPDVKETHCTTTYIQRNGNNLVVTQKTEICDTGRFTIHWALFGAHIVLFLLIWFFLMIEDPYDATGYVITLWALMVTYTTIAVAMHWTKTGDVTHSMYAIILTVIWGLLAGWIYDEST